jgi:hypothetical protein
LIDVFCHRREYFVEKKIDKDGGTSLEGKISDEVVRWMPRKRLESENETKGGAEHLYTKFSRDVSFDGR